MTWKHWNESKAQYTLPRNGMERTRQFRREGARLRLEGMVRVQFFSLDLLHKNAGLIYWFYFTYLWSGRRRSAKEWEQKKEKKLWIYRVLDLSKKRKLFSQHETFCKEWYLYTGFVDIWRHVPANSPNAADCIRIPENAREFGLYLVCTLCNDIKFILLRTFSLLKFASIPFLGNK